MRGAHHVKDAVEHVGHVGTRQVGAVGMHDVAEPFQEAARSVTPRSGQMQPLQPIIHRPFVGIVMEVVVPRGAPERQDEKMNHGPGKHYDPRTIFQKSGKVLLNVRFLLRRRLKCAPA